MKEVRSTQDLRPGDRVALKIYTGRVHRVDESHIFGYLVVLDDGRAEFCSRAEIEKLEDCNAQ